VLWSDYDSEPTILLNHGLRLDTSYYYWPDIWVQGRPGLFTGSGLPMRYSDRNGNAIDVYQAPTQFPDETTWNYPDDINTVLGNAVGSQGFYAVLTANMHTDDPQSPRSDAIVAAAQAYGVPVIASLQMLNWLDGRNNSMFSNLSWTANALSFTVTAASGAHNLEVMVPVASPSGPLTGITLSGVPIGYSLQTVKGLQYAAFLTAGGAYQALYRSTYSISGTISGAGGNAATVALSGAATATTRADASGNYKFPGLVSGAYAVTPSKTGYTFTPASQSATVTGANLTGVNFSSVAATYSLSGTISGAGGNAATVTLTGAGTATTTADASGNYAFPGLTNGTYTVTPTNTGFTFIPANRTKTVNGANVTGVNFSAPGAPVVQLLPASLSFGNQSVGVASAAQIVTLTNTGTVPLTISGITFAGTNPADFKQTNNCGTSLAVSANCAISVTFTPSVKGARSAKLSVADNAAKSPQSVALSGTGVILPTAQLSPVSIDFGTLLDFSLSASKSVTVKNTGTTALSISSITIVGTNPADFVISSNSCGATLATAATCTVKVEFNPQAEGIRAATLSFVDSAANSPQSVSLSGTGTMVKVTPTSLAFAALNVGATSTAKTVTINNVGPDVLSFSGITISGPNPGDFTVTTTCGATLGVNGSCTIAVRFVPTAIGSRAATLSVSDSDPTGPELVNLTGTGQ
jgi:hypothetical protein